MLSQPLFAAFARLDDRLRRVALHEESRAALLAGDGSGGWGGVRNLTQPDLARLLQGSATGPLAPTAADDPGIRLTRALGLPQAAADLLLVLLAPFIEPRYATLYALLQDDPAQPLATERLILSILSQGPVHRDAIGDLIRPGSKLIASSVILPVAGAYAPLGQPFTLSPDMVAALLGKETVTIPGAAPIEWVAPAGQGQARGAVVLYGSAGLREAAQAQCSALGLAVVALNPDTDGPEARAAVAAAARLATARAAALILDLRRTNEETATAAARTAARHAEAFGLPLRLLARRPLSLDVPHLPVARPGWRAQADAWRAAATALGLDLTPGTAEALAARFTTSSAERRDIIAAALADPAIPIETHAAARRFRAPRNAVMREARMRLEDLVLKPATRAGLDRLAYFIHNRARLAETSATPRHFQMDTGPVALFHGVPGTGKTVAAEALAERLGCPFFVVDLSQVVNKYVGETEKQLHETFLEAEDCGALLFFDEADALFSRRVEKASSGGEQFSNMVMGYLLQRIEIHHGPILLATNLSQGLDEALMRRFRFRVEFPMPDADLRLALWKMMLGADTPGLAAIASEHKLSGGEIRNAALKAIFLADQRGRALDLGILEEAVRMELYELGRLAREPAADGNDHGHALRTLVDRLDRTLEDHLSRVFMKEVRVLVGPPTERALSGKRPALSLAMYRIAGKRSSDALRSGFVISAWCARPEEEIEILGVIHSFLSKDAGLVKDGVSLRLQESFDAELLQKFWTSHDQPMKPALVLEAEF